MPRRRRCNCFDSGFHPFVYRLGFSFVTFERLKGFSWLYKKDVRPSVENAFAAENRNWRGNVP